MVTEEPAVVAEVGEVAGEVVEQDASDAGAPVVAPPRRARRDPRSVEPRAAPPALVETPPAGETHAEERSLIDRARVAVRRGSYHDALVSLMEHERRFASGELREERDRLVIEALIGERRTEPARRRIERYLRDYPSGLHRDDVERMAAGLR